MRNVSVLVVEDEGIVARDICTSLEDLGYSIAGTAATGENALKLMKETDPDIVLMDINLRGDMDGIEVAESIRKNSNTPVIYLTAYSDDAILSRAKLTGPFGYLIKPYEERELHMNIEMALYKHQIDLEREHYIKELQEALDKIKTLHGMLPICAWCKKIRDDKGYWSQVETYIEEHSDAEFTHGMCPECRSKLEAQMDEDASGTDKEKS